MAATTFAPDGTPLYTFPGGVALAQGEDTLARGATCVFRATPAGALVPMFDLGLQPIASVRTSETLGTFPAFYAAAPDGVLDAGSVQLPISSLEAVRAGLLAEAAAVRLADVVQLLQNSLGGFVTEAELQQALAAYTPGPGGGTDLDASDFTRTLLVEVTREAWRSRLGAGTSSLKTGSTASDAKPGDWKPEIADINGTGTAGRLLLALEALADVRRELGVVGSEAVRVVQYGSTAATPRPAGAPNGAVYWVGTGTALPTNALPADLVYLP